MDRYVTLEEFSGTGTVWFGGKAVISEVRYAIRITQRMIEARTMGGTSEIPGLKSINGWIQNDIPFALIGEPIELELEDGRRWQCFIQSSDGNLVNRGGLK
jgi:hypothetical protein